MILPQPGGPQPREGIHHDVHAFFLHGPEQMGCVRAGQVRQANRNGDTPERALLNHL
jgi:hypothetical protein